MSDKNNNQTLDTGSIPVRVVNSSGAPDMVEIVALLYPNSTGNNSVAQLASGATFTGTIETVLSLQSAQIEIVCDTAYTLVVKQYIDAAGTQQSGSRTYAKAAGVPTNINVVLPGNYFQLTVTNNGVVPTTTLAINTTFGIMDGLDDFGNMPVVTPLAAPYAKQQKATGAAVALPTQTMQNGVVVTASAANTGSIMVGASAVTATDDGTGNGYKLLPGQSTSVACANANQVYIIGVAGFVATDFVYIIGN